MYITASMGCSSTSTHKVPRNIEREKSVLVNPSPPPGKDGLCPYNFDHSSIGTYGFFQFRLIK